MSNGFHWRVAPFYWKKSVAEPWSEGQGPEAAEAISVTLWMD